MGNKKNYIKKEQRISDEQRSGVYRHEQTESNGLELLGNGFERFGCFEILEDTKLGKSRDSISPFFLNQVIPSLEEKYVSTEDVPCFTSLLGNKLVPEIVDEEKILQEKIDRKILRKIIKEFNGCLKTKSSVSNKLAQKAIDVLNEIFGSNIPEQYEWVYSSCAMITGVAINSPKA